MQPRFRWLAVALPIALLGALAIVRFDIAQRRAAFQADALVAHRVLSQRAAQHDAVAKTIALLGPGADGAAARLPAIYPQILSVAIGESVPDAQRLSRDAGHAIVADFDTARARYRLVLDALPASVVLTLDLRAMMPWREWPVAADGPIAVSLAHDGQVLALQPGLVQGAMPSGLTEGFVFERALASRSQPFVLRLRLATGPAQWPWLAILGMFALTLLGAGFLDAWLGNRSERRRAHALVRLSRVSNLNAMGELAGGIAHELNQPLAATLANAQAARRLIDADPPRLGEARDAIVHAAAQARRAADVIARMRRLVEVPLHGTAATGAAHAVIPLERALDDALGLIEPQCASAGVRVSIEGSAPPVYLDPIALEQILHNLLANALCALAEVPRAQRQLKVTLASDPQAVSIVVKDSGPGIALEIRDRLFEPFATTRVDGTGLGLSLSRKLAESMGGTLRLREPDPPGAMRHGAAFELRFPLPSARP